MYIVYKGTEKVDLADVESAKALMYSLSDYDSQEPIKKQYLSGAKKQGAWSVNFDERKVTAIALEDAERISHWMLSLGCKTVAIERIGE